MKTTPPVDNKSVESHENGTSTDKAEALIHLIEDWLADTSGCDENTWPVLRESIEAARLSSRERFRG